MKMAGFKWISESWLAILLTLGIAVIIGLLLLDPLWNQYKPPFPFPSPPQPPISAPVDGQFYLRNATLGYQWKTRDPLSLWFHPLLPFLLAILPTWLPINIWFWLLGVAAAFGCLLLTVRLARLLTGGREVTVTLLPFCLLAPGGLELATGNAEIPTLLFALALLFSVLRWQRTWLTLVCSAAVILAKPNGLYMVPILGVYAFSAWRNGEVRLRYQAIIGMTTILATWLGWMFVVDWQSGRLGTYWDLRIAFRQYVAGDAPAYFRQLVYAWLYSMDVRDLIRYSSALLIPIANLWVLALVPLVRERDRYAMAAGTFTMLAMTLILGNPNKIIVYTTTLPAHFAAHLLFIRWLSTPTEFRNTGVRWLLIGGYSLYCGAMLVVYVLGTPLGWYY